MVEIIIILVEQFCAARCCRSIDWCEELCVAGGPMTFLALGFVVRVRTESFTRRMGECACRTVIFQGFFSSVAAQRFVCATLYN